ncbi:MAG: hypothetical protein BM485_05550 [Desulfobulbaceae bacterium DB1]|nr:MAG: hypothetical protein BM485_05550 [Desulfobulbaceae bacterium DB1]
MTYFRRHRQCPGRPFLLLALFFLLAFCGCGNETEKEKKYTIGVLNYSRAAEPAFAGFKQGMAELGYREGKNITYLYSGYIVDKEKLRQEAQRLVDHKVDLIFSMSTPATLIAKEITAGTSVPVVFGPVSNPVEAGIVTDLKSPESNITGVTFRYQEPKRLEIFKEVAPAIRRLAFPYNPDDMSPQLNLQRISAVAAKLDLTIISFPLKNDMEIDGFLAALPAEIDAIYMPTDSLMASKAKNFISTALERKLPLTTPTREGVGKGALVSYGMSLTTLGKQAARLADQIFRGASPGQLPVEIAEFETAINLRTAEAIGIHVPDKILRRAIVIR